MIDNPELHKLTFKQHNLEVPIWNQNNREINKKGTIFFLDEKKLPFIRDLSWRSGEYIIDW